MANQPKYIEVKSIDEMIEIDNLEKVVNSCKKLFEKAQRDRQIISNISITFKPRIWPDVKYTVNYVTVRGMENAGNQCYSQEEVDKLQ